MRLFLPKYLSHDLPSAGAFTFRSPPDALEADVAPDTAVLFRAPDGEPRVLPAGIHNFAAASMLIFDGDGRLYEAGGELLAQHRRAERQSADLGHDPVGRLPRCVRPAGRRAAARLQGARVRGRRALQRHDVRRLRHHRQLRRAGQPAHRLLSPRRRRRRRPRSAFCSSATARPTSTARR